MPVLNHPALRDDDPHLVNTHLLDSLLSPAQIDEYNVHGRITEFSPTGKRWRLFGAFGGAAMLTPTDLDAPLVLRCGTPHCTCSGKARNIAVVKFCVMTDPDISRLHSNDNLAAMLMLLRSPGGEQLIRNTGVVQGAYREWVGVTHSAD